MIPAEKLKLYLENRTIEIAPLAFMRGRTLDNCFVILDEAQNATDMQLKMFLTRMGPSAKFIVTGDVTQIDLPKKQQSGLIHRPAHINGYKRYRYCLPERRRRGKAQTGTKDTGSLRGYTVMRC
jgi:phosphate starvation-inducible protein PhoH